MKIIRTLEEIREFKNNTGIALGTFDGFHIGHQKVILNLMKEAKDKSLETVLFTFKNHPREIINRSLVVPNIITFEEKIKIASDMGIDYLIIIDFDNEFMNIDPRRFIEEILIKKLKVKLLSVGYNYKFGKNASGDVRLLKLYNSFFESIVIEAVYYKELNVSSTLIRKLIKEGNVERVNHLLGREYKLQGEVVVGKKVGRKLGFPTANLEVDNSMCKLKAGVYITKTFINDVEYKSVTNVGVNPTFNQTNFNVETYILDFDKNVYGENIEVSFLKYIRGEIKFSSIDLLIDEIKKDVIYAKEYFEK
ncbi:bifunctional riboflavin kinase/FAD synthetase [Helicovermis profundi]|uniref:Riboflavin biosynthesis protein n=1 Tax=Helicovermis profundi TaxID=3065157 RepID=A0AAU9E3W3_9FIRM|nr:bifunctional riboflavin kinase/FAD synthetase [Clostridia bacterium S502]